MNLLERSRTLAADVAALVDLRERAKHAALIEQRANLLAAKATELAGLQAAAQVLSGEQIEVHALDRSLVAGIRSQTVDLQRRFAQDKSVMREPFPGEDFRYFYLASVAKCAASGRAALADAWRDWGERQLPRVDDEVLGILGQLPALKDAVARIREKRTLALKSVATLPDAPAAVLMLTSLASDIRTQWQSLAGDGIAAPVLAFLRAAGGQDGAPYGLLTDEVLRWLNEHGLAQSLRVRIG